jgi:phosphatidylglycerophosphate synthase
MLSFNMNQAPEAAVRNQGGGQRHFLPLIRHLSSWVTPRLVRLPVSANHVTTASLLLGLGCAWSFLQGSAAWAIAGAVLFIASTVLDYCDGEVARLKNQCTTFGMHFDSFSDWIVHSGFFISLGFGTARAADQDMWLWLGLIAAAGSTINYAIWMVLASRDRAQEGERDDTEDAAGPDARPRDAREWAVFAFRELARADFCFIVLALALFDVVWVLLPVGAVGAQVYWLTRFLRGADDYHA